MLNKTSGSNKTISYIIITGLIRVYNDNDSDNESFI